MMMLPATTASPPNFLTPSRRPAVSRPLRELPPAFLWAISNLLLVLRRLAGGGLPRRRPLGTGGRFVRCRCCLGRHLGPAPVGQDVGHAQHRQMLPVAVLAAIVLP